MLEGSGGRGAVPILFVNLSYFRVPKLFEQFMALNSALLPPLERGRGTRRAE